MWVSECVCVIGCVYNCAVINSITHIIWFYLYPLQSPSARPLFTTISPHRNASEMHIYYIQWDSSGLNCGMVCSVYCFGPRSNRAHKQPNVQIIDEYVLCIVCRNCIRLAICGVERSEGKIALITRSSHSPLLIFILGIYPLATLYTRTHTHVRTYKRHTKNQFNPKCVHIPN